MAYTNSPENPNEFGPKGAPGFDIAAKEKELYGVDVPSGKYNWKFQVIQTEGWSTPSVKLTRQTLNKTPFIWMTPLEVPDVLDGLQDVEAFLNGAKAIGGVKNATKIASMRNDADAEVIKLEMELKTAREQLDECRRIIREDMTFYQQQTGNCAARAQYLQVFMQENFPNRK